MSKKSKRSPNSIAIQSSLRLKPTQHDVKQIEIDPGLLSRFTSIIEPQQNQLTCYNSTCLTTIHEFLQGRNCTFFVYGQTGSGKTFTLFGPPNAFHQKSLEGENAGEHFGGVDIPEGWGVFPRLVLHLLQGIQGGVRVSRKEAKNGRTGEASHAVTATAVEIYMDNCYDLMRDKRKVAVAGYGRSSKTSGRGAFLETTQVKRDASGKWIPPSTTVSRPKAKTEGYEMSGAKSSLISNVHDLLDFMCVVEATRTSKSHNLNERSSRSHCVITLSIPSISQAKYMLVDLAGSERITKSGVVEVKAAEARNINTSLTSLGRCISALTGGDVFVPYRDSVLTMLLKQSLGGECFTSVVITATKDEHMHSETIASIKFGKRCAKVSNRKQAEQKTNDSAAIKEEILAEIHAIDADISKERAGGLNLDFPKSLQNSFMTNMRKYQQHNAALRDCKQKIKAGAKNIEQAMKYEESQVRNLQGILLRSMTTGIWKDPSTRYIQKVQRRIDLITSLTGMGENIDSITCIEIPLTFENLLLGYEG